MSKQSKSKSVLTIITIIVVGIGLQILLKLIPEEKQNSKFYQTIDIIEKMYVDNIDTDSLLNEMTGELLKKLDPHSEYIPPKDMSSVNESIAGQFDGIGVIFNMATDTATVLSTVTGGPGYKAGVQPGDRILKANDTTIAGVKMDQNKVVGMLRGKRGTQVKLTIQRGGENSPLVDFTLTRDVIPINSVEAQFITKNNAAYLRINNFAQNTYYDAINALNQMVGKGAKSAIIDLRGNGGGLLDQALMLANEFLPANKTIVYLEGSNFPRQVQQSNGHGIFQDLPVYILVDESSASASEILAGALQDNDRATVVGRRSFGKGLVQEQIGYNDGSAIRLTIARYYTPLGREVQKPYTTGNQDEYNREIYTRYENDEITSGYDKIIDSTQIFTTLGGKTVYGGGGIIPDIFVPADTTDVPDYFKQLYYNNSIFLFARDFADKHREAINAVTGYQQLDKMLAQHPNLYNQLIDYAARNHKVKRPTHRQKAEAKKLITDQIKAFIGRNTRLQEGGFYYLIQDQDPVMQKINELTAQK